MGLPVATLVLYTCIVSLAGTPAAVAAPAVDDRVASMSGGRPAFSQIDRALLLYPLGSAAIKARIPAQSIIHSAAQHEDAIWISGRWNTPEVDDIFIAEVSADGSLRLLPTPGGGEHSRLFPRLVTDGGEIAGLVWREGPNRNNQRLMAAAWDGLEWGPAEVVSPALGTEQTGLTASVLTDGTWLAVWAQVDGDDDLWWSRRDRSGWSKPGRVHPDNGTPDVTPRLTPVPSGALLAWSWFDGSDYRLRLSIFEGREWRELGLRSGRGADPVGFADLPTGPALLHTYVGPEERDPYRWSLIQLDRSGRELLRMEARHQDLRPPALVIRKDNLLLRWGGGHVEQEVHVELTPSAEAAP